MPALAAQVFNLSGDWLNTTFNSTGPTSVTGSVSGADVSLSADLDGFVFGLPDPDPIALTGTLDGGNTAAFTVDDHPRYGDVSGSWNATTGALLLDAVDVPSLSILSASLDGTLSASSLVATYRVNFTATGEGGGGLEGTDFAVGTINAVPEPALSALLAGVAALLAWRQRRCR